MYFLVSPQVPLTMANTAMAMLAVVAFVATVAAVDENDYDGVVAARVLSCPNSFFLQQ
jgi:hypothetical protein